MTRQLMWPYLGIDFFSDEILSLDFEFKAQTQMSSVHTHTHNKIHMLLSWHHERKHLDEHAYIYPTLR